MSSAILKRVQKKVKRKRWSTTELIVLVVAILSPSFLLATEIGPDEWEKSGTGILVAIITGIVQIARMHSEQE